MTGENFEQYLKQNDAIFHYTKLSTALEFILPSKKLKLSSLQNTSDPQEYKFIFYSALGTGNVLSKNEDKINRAHTELDRIRRLNSRILCFCENSKRDKDNGIYGYSKSRMWSQYGENQKGICLVFSKEKLNKSFLRISLASDEYRAESVVYRKQPRIVFPARDSFRFLPQFAKIA